jgi:protocatechuate 3,4-dioxygenase beta subunit
MPVPEITVTVTRDGMADTAVTDRAGDFRMESRGPGTYRVSVEVPERFYSEDPLTMVTLRDPRNCAEVAAVLHDNGHVAGRVVDAAGRPVAGLTIELGPVTRSQGSPSPSFGEARRGLGGGGRRTVTDRDGRYALARIPPGRFVLSVPAGSARATGGRPLRVFHPGVESVAAATRVAVAAGERVGLADFRIPAQQTYVAVSGMVFDADGTPAEGARVYLKGVGEDDPIVSEPVPVDFMGRFVIAARAGSEYRLFAERARAGGRSSRVDSTDEMPLTAVDGLKPVRLTLERRY